MRVLTAVGICNESGRCEYSPNGVTHEFTSGGLGDGVKCMFVTSVVNFRASLLMLVQLRHCHAGRC